MLPERRHLKVLSFIIAERALELALAIALVLGAVLLIAGCGEVGKKTGLGLLDAVLASRNLSVKALKEIDLVKQAGFAKRYDTVLSPGEKLADAELKLAKIDAEVAAHNHKRNAAYDFLEAIGKACEVAKLALLRGANVAAVLAPVIAVALNLDHGLAELGVSSHLVAILTGGS